MKKLIKFLTIALVGGACTCALAVDYANHFYDQRVYRVALGSGNAPSAADMNLIRLHNGDMVLNTDDNCLYIMHATNVYTKMTSAGAVTLASMTVPLASNKIYIGNSSGVAVEKTPSGDWTIDVGGTNVIGSGKITSGKILDGAISNADLAATAVTTSKMDVPANSKTLLDAANYATMRTNMGVNIGSDVQAYDADLTTWAGITPSANAQALLLLTYAAMRTNLTLVVGTDVQAYDADLTTWAGITPSANAQALLLLDYAAMRTNLNLVIGTDVEAWDADLDTYAGISPSANIQSFLGSATYAAARTNLGVAVGVDVQAYDAQLDTWATVTPSANGQAFVAAADYTAMRTNLLETATLYSGTYTNGPGGYTNVIVVINGAIVSVTLNP